MIVGCVKEIKNHEYRVGLTPANVKNYVNAGHRVLIEAGAGVGSGFADQEYEKAGAVLVQSAAQVWADCSFMVKVKEPMGSELLLLRPGLILYTYLHLAADRGLTDRMLEAGVAGVAYETLSERNNNTPLLAPMSQIAGRLSLQQGAKYLEKMYGGRGVLLGGVPGTPKASVVILGGGNVGLNACKVAVGMGAQVTILDVNQERLAYLDDLFGSKIQTLVSSDATVHECLTGADLVIGAVLIPGRAAPKIIKRAYLKDMKPGSVIVDVAVDQGGCSESTRVTSHDDPVFIEEGVVHYCVGNMPGAVPRTSTIALTNATGIYGLQIAGKGLEQACRENPVIYSAVNTYAGKITCRNVAESLNEPFVDPVELMG